MGWGGPEVAPMSKTEDEKEKSEVQKTVMRMTGKKLLAFLGKPNATEAECMEFAKLLDEFQDARRFYQYGG